MLFVLGIIFVLVVVAIFAEFIITDSDYRFFKENQPEGLGDFWSWVGMSKEVKKAVYHGYLYGAYYEPRTGKIVHRTNEGDSIESNSIQMSQPMVGWKDVCTEILGITGVVLVCFCFIILSN